MRPQRGTRAFDEWQLNREVYPKIRDIGRDLDEIALMEELELERQRAEQKQTSEGDKK